MISRTITAVSISMINGTIFARQRIYDQQNYLCIINSRIIFSRQRIYDQQNYQCVCLFMFNGTVYIYDQQNYFRLSAYLWSAKPSMLDSIIVISRILLHVSVFMINRTIFARQQNYYRQTYLCTSAYFDQQNYHCSQHIYDRRNNLCTSTCLRSAEPHLHVMYLWTAEFYFNVSVFMISRTIDARQRIYDQQNYQFIYVQRNCQFMISRIIFACQCIYDQQNYFRVSVYLWSAEIFSRGRVHKISRTIDACQHVYDLGLYRLLNINAFASYVTHLKILPQSKILWFLIGNTSISSVLSLQKNENNLWSCGLLTNIYTRVSIFIWLYYQETVPFILCNNWQLRSVCLVTRLLWIFFCSAATSRCIYRYCVQRRLSSACANAQADLSLHCSHMPCGNIPHFRADLSPTYHLRTTK